LNENELKNIFSIAFLEFDSGMSESFAAIDRMINSVILNDEIFDINYINDKEVLKKTDDNVCLLRKDTPEIYYIGIANLAKDKAADPYVCDWRAPVSGLLQKGKLHCGTAGNSLKLII